MDTPENLEVTRVDGEAPVEPASSVQTAPLWLRVLGVLGNVFFDTFCSPPPPDEAEEREHRERIERYQREVNMWHEYDRLNK